ncbi:protein SAWADEE HOMEODOMAIN HOMOLOG 2-like [Panicum virgatum]|uniref:protein SAWADEE HOMEODOMAIN HOMOLOG 2-like n=1 Tax=Panicum virgatum TaxID=38727 RepID=UPI0019D61020|nr:protein SAWADEE HOMEODOMAIN HOMOLOG 2-like [Panicum virgatum]
MASPQARQPTGMNPISFHLDRPCLECALAVAADATQPHQRNPVDDVSVVHFEAKSARDGAWYDVAAFLLQRGFETGHPEVKVRFSGLGGEADEWVNVHECIRQCSLPYEARQCAIVVPGDHILCFQERQKQALYFDTRVVDLQRRNHDSRGCHCRFLVRYDHDHCEEIVPLRKMCRQPETNCRLQIMSAMTRGEEASTDLGALTKRE